MDISSFATTSVYTKGPRCRYAPSPSGPLHLGNARTALLCGLHAYLLEGTLILRMEDLDRPRTKPGSVEQIFDDLHWMGLDWDEGPKEGGPAGPYTQSERDHFYEAALEGLKQRGLLFPCYCSRKDIIEAGRAPHGAGRTHLYPGTCRDLPLDAPPPAGKEGRKPAWRLRAPDRMILHEDAVLGPRRQNLAEDVGDFVMRRNDDIFGYQLAVVVDDIMMGVTDVMRGADLADSSARQIHLFELLGAPAPRFWHVPLMRDADGARMAKRNGSASIAEFREGGGTPEALVGQLAASLDLVPEGTHISVKDLADQLTLAEFQARLKAAS